MMFLLTFCVQAVRCLRGTETRKAEVAVSQIQFTLWRPFLEVQRCLSYDTASPGAGMALDSREFLQYNGMKLCLNT